MKKQLKIIGVIILIFVVYMTFFDQNNWLLQRKRAADLLETIEHIDYLKTESEKLDKELQGLNASPEIIEKHAREKYFHKKEGEDVYIIKDTSSNKNLIK
jgi:cell division protein DivIC